jgi:hypothetical protein
MWQSTAVPLIMARKQREKTRKGWGQEITFQGTPSMTYFLQLGLLS